MGLIGNLLQPLYAGGVSVILPPTAFMQKPMRWLHAVSRYRAHTSGAPNFAYDLCVRAATEDNCAGLDLSSWRVAFNGAEPVRARTLDAFAERFAPYSFQREAFMPCYGLAESTLMVTGGRVDAGVTVLRVSKAMLAESVLASSVAACDAIEVVGCGDEVTGSTVRIADPQNGALIPEGAVGEVLVLSDSVCGGYWGNECASRDAFCSIDGENYLRTGDLAARRDGQLYVVGRVKELLILNGRNIHPADIEEAVLSATAERGVTRALVAGVAGATSEDILLFIEMSREGLRKLDEADLLAALRRAAMQAAEAPLAAIVVAKQGALPLTSSGKVRRGACRDLFLVGKLPGIAVLDPGARRLAPAQEVISADSDAV